MIHVTVTEREATTTFDKRLRKPASIQLEADDGFDAKHNDVLVPEGYEIYRIFVFPEEMGDHGECGRKAHNDVFIHIRKRK